MSRHPETTTEVLRAWRHEALIGETLTRLAHVSGWAVPVTLHAGGQYELGRPQRTRASSTTAEGVETDLAVVLARLSLSTLSPTPRGRVSGGGADSRAVPVRSGVGDLLCGGGHA